VLGEPKSAWLGARVGADGNPDPGTGERFVAL
jgi:hypothetical protein